MGKKGFTLIELIGVILMISLLILLVFPKIVDSVRNFSDDTDNLTKEMIYKASELYILKHKNEFPKVNGNKFVIKLKDLVDENLLTSPIELSDNDDITNDKCVEVTYEEKYKYELKDASDCETKTYCGLDDRDGDKQIDIGEEVMCGTENFYVLPNDPNTHKSATDGNITLITKYNLNVGNDVQLGTLGMQNPRAIGGSAFFTRCNFTEKEFDDYLEANSEKEESEVYLSFYNLGYGCSATVPFSETNYWGNVAEGTFIYNSQSLLYQHIEKYKKYMQNMGINVKEASLASFPQYERIKSGQVTINSTIFWLGFAGEYDGCLGVSSGCSQYYDGLFYGVRPVIVVSSEDIIIP